MTEAPPRPDLELVTEAGPWGGPVFRYRGAEIRCLKGSHVCALSMPGHPLDGRTFGVPGTITPLVDLWIREQRLPDHMRPVPKSDTGGPQDRK
jgi:hypothetical protein